MSKLSDEWKSLLNQPVFVHVATLMPDGTPQVSPVWVDVEGEQIVINSAQGRVKDKNLRRDPRVALSVTAPDNAYKALLLRGKVVKITTDGAEQHIDKLAKKYLGKDKYPYGKPGDVRVKYYIEPTAISG
jgi:PPOX class probable F420-dependent enzyme